MDFLNNTWFVGITGGIISGVIVYFMTDYLTNNFGKKEYLKLVKEVNLKISKTLIMSISEGKIPSPQVINALLSSTAKRNSIELKDINNVQETYDDLVSELFETIFIPVEKKQSLANELMQEKASSTLLVLDEVSEKSENDATLLNSKEREIKKSLYNLLMAAVSSMCAFVLILFNERYSSIFGDQAKILSITSASFLMVIAALSYRSAQKSSNRLKKLNKKNNANSL